MKKKRIILVGKAASGKDHARKVCEQWLGLKYAVSYTTRTPRDGEEDGKDYFFISSEEFNRMTAEDIWYESVKFNGWWYGTTREQMKLPGQVFIMTPHGLSHVTPQDRRESLVIYFNIDEGIRRERMSRRGNYVDSIERRIAADYADFINFIDFDIIIDDPYFKIGDIIEKVHQYYNLNILENVSNK